MRSALMLVVARGMSHARLTEKQDRRYEQTQGGNRDEQGEGDRTDGSERVGSVNGWWESRLLVSLGGGGPELLATGREPERTRVGGHRS